MPSAIVMDLTAFRASKSPRPKYPERADAGRGGSSCPPLRPPRVDGVGEAAIPLAPSGLRHCHQDKPTLIVNFNLRFGFVGPQPRMPVTAFAVSGIAVSAASRA